MSAAAFSLPRFPWISFPQSCMVNGLGICQADLCSVMRAEQLKDMDAVIAKIEKEIPYPVFVKPSNAGSSRGVNKSR